MKQKVKIADIKYDNDSKYVTFQVHTAKYRTLPTKKYINRKPWVPVDNTKILADIPGSIYKIYVKPGDNVKKGTLLIELDAMKMYNKFFAPANAKVVEIHVNEGEKVPKNTVMITLEYDVVE